MLNSLEPPDLPEDIVPLDLQLEETDTQEISTSESLADQTASETLL